MTISFSKPAVHVFSRGDDFIFGRIALRDAGGNGCERYVVVTAKEERDAVSCANCWRKCSMRGREKDVIYKKSALRSRHDRCALVQRANWSPILSMRVNL